MTAMLDATRLQWKVLGAGSQRNSMTGLATAISLHGLLVLLVYFLAPIELPPIIYDKGPVVNLSGGMIVHPPATEGSRYIPTTSHNIPYAMPIPVNVLDDIESELKRMIGRGSNAVGEDGGSGSGEEPLTNGDGSSSYGSDGGVVDLTTAFKAGVEKFPKAIREERPEYPDVAKRLGIEGTVIVKLLIDKNGKPQKAEIFSSENVTLDESAMRAAMKWLFVPAVMNNNTVAVWVTVPFHFKLLSR